MTTTKPPVVFWIISVIALIWNLMGIGATGMELMMSDDMINMMEPAQKALYENTPDWTRYLNVFAVFTGLLGSILLLLRRKMSILLFAASLVAVIVYMGYFLFFTDMLKTNGASAGLIMPLLVICIAGFLLYYARKASFMNWTR